MRSTAMAKRGGLLSREREGSRTEVDGYALLGNAVVKRAADDYIEALCAKYDDREKERKRLDTIAECERFFTGDLINIYTRLDGRELMEGIKRMCEIHNYDIKEIDGRRTAYSPKKNTE